MNFQEAYREAQRTGLPQTVSEEAWVDFCRRYSELAKETIDQIRADEKRSWAEAGNCVVD